MTWLNPSTKNIKGSDSKIFGIYPPLHYKSINTPIFQFLYFSQFLIPILNFSTKKKLETQPNLT